MSDVTDIIDKGRTFCLNEKRGTPMLAILSEDSGATLQSDADPQLLMYLPFRETVRLTHILIKAPPGVTAPTELKLFINKPTFGFDDVDDVEPAQIIALKPGDTAGGGIKIPLRAVRFTSVTSLVVFVDNDNDGAEFTEISGIKVFGNTIAGTNVSEIKKC